MSISSSSSFPFSVNLVVETSSFGTASLEESRMVGAGGDGDDEASDVTSPSLPMPSVVDDAEDDCAASEDDLPAAVVASITSKVVNLPIKEFIIPPRASEICKVSLCAEQSCLFIFAAGGVRTS